jgi:sarcosine oxidase, subunit alpha
VEDSHAGTRGFEIGALLAEEIGRLPSVEVWLDTTAVAVFADRVVGVVRGGRYVTVRPRALMVATGARERMISFPGNSLPGVYGAGAFQTLVNRDLVKSSERVLIVGGGNVGLIAGYHAIQAGIEVAALIEALPQVGGYKVHADKLMRLGVPVFTRHTIVCATGTDRVASATVAALDDKWNVTPGTEKTFAVDTVLIAVGLAEVNEFYLKAKQFGMDVFHAGDAQEIA